MESNSKKVLKRTSEDYRFGKVIGEGSFSTVYLAKEIDSGKEYAIKVCDKDHIIKEKKQDYVKREKVALHILNNSPGIISLACTFQDRSKLYFVLTFAANGELLKYIRSRSLTLDCARFYAAELLRAIEEMHRKNIIHRDLKPENLLLTRSMHLMIADLGSSKILPDDYDYDMVQAEIEKIREERSNDSDSEIERPPPSSSQRRASFVGTAQYVSPEILKGNAAHLATDLWSLGCIVYQMVCGAPPFNGPTEYLIFQKILNGEYDFPEGFDESAKDLVTQLLRFNPKDRLGSDESSEIRYHSIRNHPFFEGIKWNELHKQVPPKMQLPHSLNGEEPHVQEEYNISDDIEPGLGRKQLRRILQMEFGSSESSSESEKVQPTSAALLLEKQLQEQKASNEWSAFVESTELILKFGFVNKRKKGLFARKRMLLLTNRPRLIYIDPNTNVKKGEIPFDSNLVSEPKNFRMFLLHTPNRIYYLEDTTGEALVWCEAIDSAKLKYIKMS